ncbi:MAG: diaminopimelate decarboxylase [Hydrogenibacillus schlegelii]|uniref:Diaminopimelate decarboxylase n=1 Tax=Hydrogenibacillus schlegelii TaxID=1484 RepID=A0A947D3F0_HYDSH|nr:diaminopimelate decarboxylase [Hydrogenibacillus schlegelii]
MSPKEGRETVFFLKGTSRIDERGRLEIGGVPAARLAEAFGTPLWVYDEALIRERLRAFQAVLREAGVTYDVAFACKAFCVRAMTELVREEGASLDVVSGGELYTALQAGFPPERIHFHGNNKSDAELALALAAGVGVIIVDNFDELERLRAFAAGERDDLLRAVAAEVGLPAGAFGPAGSVGSAGSGGGRRPIDVLLRVTPGIHADTHAYISTGQEESKFGFDLGSGQVATAIERTQAVPGLRLRGLSIHIGSQIFSPNGYLAAVEKLLGALPLLPPLDLEVLNLGGGFGIRHVEEEAAPEATELLRAVVDGVKERFRAAGRPLPALWFEPGRSIVGEAGWTLYRVGAIKDLPGIRRYVAVDGGMSDNIRPALYGARYTALLADRALEPATEAVSVVGKLCESGDVLIERVMLPPVRIGDLLAVPATGAYTFAMASHYNRLPRPAVVFVRDGRARLVVRRETYADLVRHDVPLGEVELPLGAEERFEARAGDGGRA